MYYPQIDEIKKINKNNKYKRIPLSYEIYSDSNTPIEVMRRLKKESKHCYLLESIEDLKNWGRYTFLGFNPILEFTCQNGDIKIKGDYKNYTKTNLKEETILKNENPKKHIRKIINDNKTPQLEKLPPFTGGLVGYFAYDYIKYNEPTLKLESENKDGFKDIDLMLFDKVIIFDNFKQKIIIIVNIKTENLEENYQKGKEEIQKIIHLIKNGQPAKNKPLKLKSEFKPLFTKKEYMEIIEKAKNYIKEGDIFQVVPSNRIEAKISGSLFDTYRVLRTTNPSPYMFYFSSDTIEIAGASPETLVKLKNGQVYTYPLAGTRPRGKTDLEDEKISQELLKDEKELAEHNMLVDLGRNDIGKISKIGSVKLKKYLNIEKFSHVMHIGSTVEGTLKEDEDFLSAIDSILPAGTLSGAPKIRACQIIDELENNKRGIYGGAIGYISLSGNLDTCIGIRIAFARNNKVFIRSGGGIVADSNPELEYQETINKAAAVIEALKTANGGIK